jgi:hypothetical protein
VVLYKIVSVNINVVAGGEIPISGNSVSNISIEVSIGISVESPVVEYELTGVVVVNLSTTFSNGIRVDVLDS